MTLSLSFLLAFSIFLLLPAPLTAAVTFLANTYPPFSDCTKYIEDPQSSSVFGAEVELLRSAFSLVNWTEGTNYTFECTNSSTNDLFERFNTDNETQLGVFGGVAISSSRLQNGLRFSQPTTSSPLPLVYKKTSKGWFFRRGFDPVSWGILAATVFIMGGLLYFLENREAAYINMLYNAFCQFFLTPDYPLAYFPSKLANYFSTFLVAIIVIVFTAVSTNIFDTDRNFGNNVSLENLDKEKVYSNVMLGDYLTQYGIPVTPIDDFNYLDLLHKIDELDINYLVVDGPYADFLVRQRCDLYTAKNEIDLIHYGIMFHSNFSRDLLNQISEGISNAKQAKSFDSYISEYYLQKPNLSFCQDKIQNDHEAVSLYETRGLWYILLISMGLAIGFLIVDRIGRLVKKNLQIYGLQGVRSKRDGKIQRRVATILAIHAGVSIQSAAFLKKLSQQALESHLMMTRMSLAPLKLLKAHQQVQRRPDEVCIEIKDYPSLKSNKASFVGWLKKAASERNSQRRNRRGLSQVKGMNFTDYLEASFKRDTSNSEAESQRRSSDSRDSKDKDTPPLRGNTIKSVDKTFKKSETRRSSFLNQSAQNYQLDKKLHLKLGTLVEKEFDLNIKGRLSIENNSQVSGGSPKAKDMEKAADPNKKFRIITKSLGFVERIFGKKGMKKNKKINTVANTLLAQKEAMLSLEFEKKKAEVISRPSILGSNPSIFLARRSISPASPKANSPHADVSPRGSPNGRNETRNPSIFRLKHMKNQSSKLGSTADSPENRIGNFLTIKLKDDSVKEPSTPSSSAMQRLNFQDYLYAYESPRLPSGVIPKSLSTIGKGRKEEYNFGTQDETPDLDIKNSFSGDLMMYNFSQIMNISPISSSRRHLVKKDNTWSNM